MIAQKLLRSFGLPAFCLFLSLVTATPQTPPAPRETPPDQKAFNEAGKLTDPAQKIAAYEKGLYEEEEEDEDEEDVEDGEEEEDLEQ